MADPLDRVGTFGAEARLFACFRTCALCVDRVFFLFFFVSTELALEVLQTKVSEAEAKVELLEASEPDADKEQEKWARWHEKMVAAREDLKQLRTKEEQLRAEKLLLLQQAAASAAPGLRPRALAPCVCVCVCRVALPCPLDSSRSSVSKPQCLNCSRAMLFLSRRAQGCDRGRDAASAHSSRRKASTGDSKLVRGVDERKKAPSGKG